MQFERGSAIVRFGLFEADFSKFELRRQGVKVPIQEQPLQVLHVLVDRHGELVSREDLHQKLWPEEEFGRFDQRINTAVNKLRQALGDSSDNPRFVETVPRHGYRFLAPLEPIESPTGKSQRLTPRRGAILAAVALVAVTALAFYLLNPSPVHPEPQDRVMLAVLPFDNFTGDPSQDYFSDGLTEEVISHLGELNSEKLGVIARTSVMGYKNTKESVTEIGRALNVEYVLEGSVRREEDRVRVTAQLVRVDDQTHLWAQSFDRPLSNMLDLQFLVSERIANSLAIEFLPGSVLVPETTEEAYEAYLKGRFFRNQLTETGFQRGVENFRLAVREDPSFAPAYAGLASCFCLLSGHGMEVVPPSEAMPQAFDLAAQALELDDTLPEAWAVQGMVNLKYNWDFPAAERVFQRALQLNSNYAQGRLWYSLYLEAMGRQTEAVEQARRASVLDPLSLGANVNLAHQLGREGSWAEASSYAEKALELNPDFWGARLELGNILRDQGKLGRALDQYTEAARLSGGNAVSRASLANAHALVGDRAGSKRLLRLLIADSESKYISPAFIAYVYAGLGEVDEAFRWLDRAYELRSRYLVWLRVGPEFDRLRSDPRFEDLAVRIGLPR